MKQPKRVSVSSNEFGAVLEIINAHRAKALVSVNVEHLLTNWEIERLFYIVYSFRERLKKLELRRCLVNDTYSSLLGGDKKNFSKALVAAYPDSPIIFKDSAFVDFLNLPEKHSDGLCEPR